MIPDQGSGGSDLDGAGVKASQGSSVITHQEVPEASANVVRRTRVTVRCRECGIKLYSTLPVAPDWEPDEDLCGSCSR